MLFVWVGFLKDGAEDVAQSVQLQTSDFIGQPYIDVRSAGPLRDEQGKRAAMMMVFDVADRAAAEEFVKGSPYLNAGLYAEHHLYQFQDEIG